MRGPALLPLLDPALWAERLLGFRHGQHGRRRVHDDDEGWGRRLGRGGHPPPWHTHVPLRLPLSAQGRPVLWPRSVRVCETTEAEMHVCNALSSFLSLWVCVCVCQKDQTATQMGWMTEWVSTTHPKPCMTFIAPEQSLPLVHHLREEFHNADVFRQRKACLWGILCSRLWESRYSLGKEEIDGLNRKGEETKSRQGKEEEKIRKRGI